MAISPQDRARAKELAKELVKITGGRTGRSRASVAATRDAQQGGRCQWQELERVRTDGCQFRWLLQGPGEGLCVRWFFFDRGDAGAAARAIHCDEQESWQCYRRFATRIWQGNIDEVIAGLDDHQAKLGLPPKDASESDPREIVRRAAVYYRNHRTRMNYPEYRSGGA